MLMVSILWQKAPYLASLPREWSVLSARPRVAVVFWEQGQDLVRGRRWD